MYSWTLVVAMFIGAVLVVVMLVVVVMMMMENTNCITMDEAQWSLALPINGIEFWFYGVTRSEFQKKREKIASHRKV